MQPKFFILPFVIFIAFIHAYSQSEPRFSHLTSDQGLTSNYTRSLLKDSRGFLWIGTDAGINRFDGKNIIAYSHTIGDSSSLLNNTIKTIYEDKDHRIWIGTAKGLSILVPETSKFTNYKKIIVQGKTIDLSESVLSIVQFNNKIWLTTPRFILSAPIDSFPFAIQVDSIPISSDEKKRKYFLPNQALTTKSGIWFSTSIGALYIDHEGSIFNKEENPNHWAIFDKGWISAFINEGDSVLYFTTFAFPGIYKYHTVNFILDSIPFLRRPEVADINIMSLCIATPDEIWGASIRHGVFRLNTKSLLSQFYGPDKSKPNSLASLQASQILTDEQGTIFIATDRGVDYFNPLQPQFKILNIDNTELANTSVASVEDNQGNFWFATLNKGLFHYETFTGKINQFIFPGKYNHIWTMKFEEDELLLSTEGGLATFSLASKILKPLNKELPPDVQQLTETSSVFIRKDNEGSYWIGLYMKGLLKYNFETGEYIHFSTKDSIHQLPAAWISTSSLDTNGILWIGYFSNNLSAINTKDNSIVNFKIPYDEDAEIIGKISSIKTDQKGNLWIATSEAGLFKYNIADKTFTNYNTRQGLSSNALGSIVIDHQNNLWINTSNGLNKFDPLTELITVYNSADGLTSNHYNTSPGFVTRDGTIFLKSDNSLISFNPVDIQPNPNQPVLVFPSFLKSGQRFIVDSRDKELNFSYRDKTITFEFFGINFIDPEKTRYAYILDGYDDYWHYSQNSPTATYTNLPGGDYTLRIKASNKADDWDVAETTMKIHITRPYWLQWWFISLCFSFCVFLIYIIYQYRLSHFKKLQAIRNKISQDLHDDIGSTLSSISIFSTAVTKMKPDRFPEVISTVSLIGQNARIAMENMSDIVWAINPSNDTIKDMMDRLQIFAVKILDARNIRLEMEIPEALQRVQLNMQQRKNIYLILREAINNVAKYSEASHCMVKGKVGNKKIAIEVSDNGNGFDKIQPSLGGNGLLNMKQRAEELKAQFQISSEKLKGTTISFQLAYN